MFGQHYNGSNPESSRHTSQQYWDLSHSYQTRIPQQAYNHTQNYPPGMWANQCPSHVWGPQNMNYHVEQFMPKKEKFLDTINMNQNEDFTSTALQQMVSHCSKAPPQNYTSLLAEPSMPTLQTVPPGSYYRELDQPSQVNEEKAEDKLQGEGSKNLTAENFDNGNNLETRKQQPRRQIDQRERALQEDQRKAHRRLKNKLAAARCRQRKLDKINTLTKTADDLSKKLAALRNHMSNLQEEHKEIYEALMQHQLCEKIGSAPLTHVLNNSEINEGLRGDGQMGLQYLQNQNQDTDTYDPENLVLLTLKANAMIIKGEKAEE